MIVSIMVVLGFGPEWILSADTGASMVDLSCTLVCIVISFSFLLPFLTDCGIMEFFGVILRPVLHPLFRVPGRASVDLIASWFGASNAAEILTREQYMKGFYTKREAAAVAPATLVGFMDMFIPALLISGMESVKTRFVIGAFSLVQIIYLTEVGTIIIKSEIPLNIGKLFIVFLERTLIAIPLLVLCANLLL